MSLFCNIMLDILFMWNSAQGGTGEVCKKAKSTMIQILAEKLMLLEVSLEVRVEARKPRLTILGPLATPPPLSFVGTDSLRFGVFRRDWWYFFIYFVCLFVKRLPHYFLFFCFFFSSVSLIEGIEPGVLLLPGFDLVRSLEIWFEIQVPSFFMPMSKST